MVVCTDDISRLLDDTFDVSVGFWGLTALLGREDIRPVTTSYKLVVLHRNAQVRAREADVDALGLTSRQAVGIKVIGTALVTDLEAGEVRVAPHHRVRTLHLASVTHRNRYVCIP